MGPAPLKPAAPSSLPLFLQLPVPLPAPFDPPNPITRPGHAPSLHPTPALPSPPAPNHGAAAVGLLCLTLADQQQGWDLAILGHQVSPKSP